MQGVAAGHEELVFLEDARERVEKELTSQDWRIRSAAIQTSLLTRRQLERALLDADWRVRVAAIRSQALNSAQYRYASEDEHEQVRVAAQARQDEILAAEVPPLAPVQQGSWISGGKLHTLEWSANIMMWIGGILLSVSPELAKSSWELFVVLAIAQIFWAAAAHSIRKWSLLASSLFFVLLNLYAIGVRL